MWSLFLTTFNTLTAPTLLPEEARVLAPQASHKHDGLRSSLFPAHFEISQSLNLAEAVSPWGYSLKYSSDWQRFTPQISNPNLDIFLGRNFSNPQGGFWVTLTTTVMKYIGIPRELPDNVKEIDIAAERYAETLALSGYKVYEKNEFMINERKAIRLLTETPQKKGSITVLIEGKDDQMVVSTSVYPIESSIINEELLEQVIEDIDRIQTSITIR